LREAARFAAARSERGAVRVTRDWLALAAVAAPTTAQASGAVAVRFGCVVPKRLARRAVDRNLIKRVLREAARQAAPGLDRLQQLPMDVVLRLRKDLPPAALLARADLRRALRTEAGALLEALSERLRDRAARLEAQ
jgi:ribonuclease P protein component